MDYSEIFNQRGAMYHQAMMKFPHARKEEFTIPLSMMKFHQNYLLADLPSGGGYIHQYLNPNINLICLESSSEFAKLCREKRLNVDIYQNNKLPLPSNTLDGIISIAGIHHIQNKQLLFKEMKRVLKNTGELCIADVQENSNVALFLDDIVDKYSETGHKGYYLSNNTLLDLISSGFKHIEDRQLQYHWYFSSIDDLTLYFKLLFGLTQASNEQVLAGIKRYLTILSTRNTVKVNWSLRCFYVPGTHFENTK
jgi:ubiquinone/menaquinone biosynthesis C-methylase UbiE